MEFDFSQPVDAIDKVPEQFRSLYVEKEGKHVVNDAMQGVTGAITALHKANKATRDENDRLRKGQVDLTPLAEFGTDVATIAQTVATRMSEMTAKGGDTAKAVEKLRTELGTAHTAALKGEQGKTEALRGQLYKTLVTNEATKAISEAKGVVELILPFLEKQIKVTEQDGQFVPIVVAEDGQQRYSPATGTPMTIKELVADMRSKEQFGRLFDSEVQTGGTGSQNNQRRTVPANTGAGQKTSIQKIAGALPSLMGAKR